MTEFPTTDDQGQIFSHTDLSNAVLELERQRDLFNLALAEVSSPERLDTSDSIGILLVSLDRLCRSIRHNTSSTDDALRIAHHVIKVTERLDAPLGRLYDALGPQERSRNLQAVVKRAREVGGIVDEIEKFVEPDVDAETKRNALRLTWQTMILSEMTQNLESRLRSLEATIARNRDSHERSKWAIDTKLHEIDVTLNGLADKLNATVDGHIGVAVARFDELAENLAEKAAQHEAVLNADLVGRLSPAYSEAGERERRSADIWRRMAVAFGLAGLIAFASGLWQLGSTFSPTTIATHLGLTIVCGGLATYSARQSAEHRREERQLRDKKLRISDSISILFEMSPAIREELTKGLVESIIRERARGESDLSEAALSVLPVDKLAQLIKSLPPSVDLKGSSARNPRHPDDTSIDKRDR